MYHEKYNGPDDCDCGGQVSLSFCMSTGLLRGTCSVKTIQFITVNRRPKMMSTGNERCEFNWYQRVCEAPVNDYCNIIETDPDCFESKESIALKETIRAYKYSDDRNKIAYYIKLYESRTKLGTPGRRALINESNEKLKQMDDRIIFQMEQNVKLLIWTPTYSTINLLMWNVVRYIDPKKEWKMNSKKEIIDTIKYVNTQISILRKEGFKYIEPKHTETQKPIQKIIEKQKIKPKIPDPKEKIDIMKPVIHPSEKNHIMMKHQSSNKIEFSDDEESEDEDEEDEDDEKDVEDVEKDGNEGENEIFMKCEDEEEENEEVDNDGSEFVEDSDEDDGNFSD